MKYLLIIIHFIQEIAYQTYRTQSFVVRANSFNCFPSTVHVADRGGKVFSRLVLFIEFISTVCIFVRAQSLRPCLYGLGYPRQPSPRATLAELTFHLFLWKIQLTVYMRTRTRLGGARQLGWASCLASAGRVTLSGGTTFSHINTLARPPEARWLKLFPEPAILSNM